MIATNDFPYHPASELFPLHSGEIAALADNIREHGLLVPILTYQGMILDGRRRHLACQQAGVPPRFEEWVPVGDETPTELVASLNLHRRQLTIAEKVQVALKIVEARRAEARARQEASRAKPGEQVGSKARAPVPAPSKPAENAPSRPRDVAAKATGLAPRTVQHAMTVEQKGVPEVRKAMADGSVGVRTAAEIARLPVQEQLQALEEERRELVDWDEQDQRRGRLDKARKALARAAKALDAAGEEIMAGDVQELLERVSLLLDGAKSRTKKAQNQT